MPGVWQEPRASANWVLHVAGRVRTIEHVFASSTRRPDFATWSDGALCREIEKLCVTVERAQAELTRLTGVWLARQAWTSESALSATSWLATHAPMTRASGARLCTTA